LRQDEKQVAQRVFGLSHATRQIRVSRRTTCLVLGTRSEKDIEGNTVVSFDFEKFNADRVLLYPLDRREPHLHRISVSFWPR
jgi:hypothetical protein